jgi:hypothetical protein
LSPFGVDVDENKGCVDIKDDSVLTDGIDQEDEDVDDDDDDDDDDDVLELPFVLTLLLLVPPPPLFNVELLILLSHGCELL